ncbi:mCG142416 [Mus musculus]|nr:mCG142416 [Mus musculus]
MQRLRSVLVTIPLSFGKNTHPAGWNAAISSINSAHPVTSLGSSLPLLPMVARFTSERREPQLRKCLCKIRLSASR